IGNKDLQVPNGGDGEADGVVPAGYQSACNAGGAGGGLPPGFVSGMTMPQYGMPTCGTPIGLPGPPHIPLGNPAGLQRYVITNHTKMHIPGPVRDVRVSVKQEPGFSYPEPVNRVHIVEHSHVPLGINHQPLSNQVECDEDEHCEE